jgi:hypothetical protein
LQNVTFVPTQSTADVTNVPADGGTVCDTAAMLGDMIKETLYIGLFTTRIVIRMCKVKKNNTTI